MQGIGLLAGFVTGLAGSLHCAAACSGISFALMVPARPGGGLAVRFANIQAGRMTAYALAGALVGGGSGTAMALFGLAGANHVLRIGAALMMTWTGLAVAGLAPSPHRLSGMMPLRLPWPALLSRSASTPQGGFVLGLSWGLMPCGMVYLALMTATFTGTAGAGAAYMAAFFFGTLPALASTTFGMTRWTERASPLAAHRLPIGLSVVALAAATLVIPSDMARLLCNG